LIREDDFYGVERFLGKFGGMGSISDLVFHPLNGNASDDREARALNERLEVLRTRAYDLAVEARRDFNRS
jgi:hypothetical protein